MPAGTARSLEAAFVATDSFSQQAFIANARRIKDPQARPGQFLRIVPNLVVEIPRLATTQRDRLDNKKTYETNGVDELWLVDATKRKVRVYRHVDVKHTAGKRFTARETLQRRILPRFRKATRSPFV